MRLILADDNIEMHKVVIRLLENKYEIVGAVADGRALVDAVEEFRPDVGIIDISMPLLNGIEAVIEIKKQGSPMKIVFLTVNEDADFVRAAFEAGAEAYVVKRQMVTDLPIAVERALAGQEFISPGCDFPKSA